MTDLELIKFMWYLLHSDLSDGETPTDKECELVVHELFRRGILEEDEWPC